MYNLILSLLLTVDVNIDGTNDKEGNGDILEIKKITYFMTTLEAEGISVEVINLHTIKPFDEAAIIKSLKKTGCVVTAEEHNVIGGMGDVVAQAAAKHYPVPVEFIGTQDTFGESGTPNQLLTKYGLDAVNIVAAAKKVISRKG